MSEGRRMAWLICGIMACAANPARAQCAAPAQRAIDAHKFSEARPPIDALLRASPNDDRAMDCLGRLLLEQNQPAEARVWLEKAVAIDPRSAQHKYWLLNARGAQAAATGPVGIARHAFELRPALEEVVVLDPTIIDARRALMGMYAVLPSVMGGNREKARAQAAAILKLNPMRGHDATAFLAERENDVAGAEKEYLAGIAAQPDSEAGYDAVATFYGRQKRFVDAIAMYEKQIKVMPGDAPVRRVSNAHYSLGRIFERTGDRDRAIMEYRAAITANPDNEDATKALAALIGAISRDVSTPTEAPPPPARESSSSQLPSR